MKRISALILSIVCSLSLFGCAGKTQTDKSETTSSKTSTSCPPHDWQRTENLNEYTAKDKCSVCGDTRIYTDSENVANIGAESSFTILRYNWDGYGISRKTISNCALGYAIIDCLSKLEETGSIDPQISEDILGDAVNDLPVEHGTVWIDCGSVGLFRLNPEMSEICRVERHFGEGKILKMTETLDQLLSQAWYYHPYDYWSGEYDQGIVTLNQIFKAESAVEQVYIENIQIENKSHSDYNKITLRFTASENKTVSVRVESYQSNDNLGSSESKKIELVAGEDASVEFKFYGFVHSYFVTVTVDNTKINLVINPK